VDPAASFRAAARRRWTDPAGWDQAAEQYRSTVFNAFQNVSDALQAIERDKEAVRWAVAAKDGAIKNRCLTIAVFVEYDGKNPPQLDVPRDQLPKLLQWWRKNCPPNQVREDTPYYMVGKDGKPEDDKDGWVRSKVMHSRCGFS
jgi:hypothetical protein